MRRGRMLAPGVEAGERGGIYHCVSRVVERRLCAGARRRKKHFVRLMRLYEEFCGVQVLVVLRDVEPLPSSCWKFRRGRRREYLEREFYRRLSLLYSEGAGGGGEEV